MAEKTKTERILSRVGTELKKDEPGIVLKVRAREGSEAAQRVRTAILLSKARRAGARIPTKEQARKIAAKRLLNRR